MNAENIKTNEALLMELAQEMGMPSEELQKNLEYMYVYGVLLF